MVFDERAPEGSSFYPVRFITSGQARIGPEEVGRGLASCVRNVVKRIEDVKTEDARRLRANWNAVGSSRMREDDLCRSAAQLGLDPYDEDQRFWGHVSPRLLKDFAWEGRCFMASMVTDAESRPG